jgi:flagellar FliL protein
MFGNFMLFLLYRVKKIYANHMKNINKFDYDDTPSFSNNTTSANSLILKRIIPLFLLIFVLVTTTYFFIKQGNNTLDIKNSKINYFYDLGDLVVNLSNNSSKSSYLKIDLTFYLFNQNDSEVIQNMLPIIKDSFQLFLRELRIDDVNGSGGAFYVKAELLKRANNILTPVQVKDILIRELLVN